MGLRSQASVVAQVLPKQDFRPEKSYQGKIPLVVHVIFQSEGILRRGIVLSQPLKSRPWNNIFFPGLFFFVHFSCIYCIKLHVPETPASLPPARVFPAPFQIVTGNTTGGHSSRACGKSGQDPVYPDKNAIMFLTA